MYDLRGQKFGRLLVIERAGSSRGSITYLCKCDCGKKVIVPTGSLRSGNTKSCGCLSRDLLLERRTKHGKCGTRLYRIWKNMKARCLYKCVQTYKHYGGRGITVCDEWANSYSVFEEWAIANGYRDDLTIDRVDVNGNYCAENCKWVSMLEQANNTRKNHYIEFNGEMRTLSEWARLLNMPYSKLKYRIDAGWDLEEAFNPKDFSYRKGVRKDGKKAKPLS